MYDQDGESGVHTHMTNTRNTPIEVLERLLPVTVIEYGLNDNSEGPGQYRGGFGIKRVIQFDQDDISCQIISDRVKYKPWGLQNELHASGSSFIVKRKDGLLKRLDSKVRLMMNKGDQLVIKTSGGGGYGNLSNEMLEISPTMWKVDSFQLTGQKIYTALAQNSRDISKVGLDKWRRK